MKKISFYILAILMLTSLLFTQTDNKSSITTGTLFREMIDMSRLTRFPHPVFRTIQYSSYDHRSTLPGGPDWFANSDGFGKEPIPNFEKILEQPDENGIGRYLIADVKGPGAIVRLWTAAISGKIKVYIDSSKKAIFNGKADMFFHRTYDFFPESKKLKKERFETTIYQRDASYAPIPFAKNLRVEWIGNVNDIHFYQLQVRLYEPGTKVVSFSPADIATYGDIIDKVSLILSNPDNNLEMKSLEPEKIFNASLESQENKEIFSIEGSQAMERLTIKLKAENLEKALRQTVLHIICDNYPWGQVQCPVGDFFGAAPGVNPYQSLPFTVSPDAAMICRYIMPFEKSLKIVMENLGEQSVEITGSALFQPYQWTDRSLYFRARWRVNHNLTASNKKVMDLPFLIAFGKGIYVGTTSYLLNPISVPTPWGSWWGEGDEKVFVDNETIPSIFGTGSEDYYNYSWSAPDIFFFPYCGQPRNDGPGNRGFVTNYRWHILDPIPFRQSIRFYMELFHHQHTPGLSYARIGYCYACTGATDDHMPIMPEDVRYLQLPENWEPVARKGSRNAVFFSAEDIVINKENITIKQGRLWAGSKLMCWLPKKKKERITFKLSTKTSGKKRIHLTLALTPQSGQIKVLVDGKHIKLNKDLKSINLFRPHRTLLRNFSFPTADWEAGDHTLVLEFLGTEKDIMEPEIGIDFIWVQDVKK
jgi:hypothetical protein